MAALDFKMGSKNKTPKILRVGYIDPADFAVEHWIDFKVSSELIQWIRESHDKGLIIFDLQEIYV